MIHPSTPFGFRVLGPTTGPRRHVDALAALLGYASCEGRAETHREAYLSYYTFGPDFVKHLNANTGSTAGFDGVCWTPFLFLDIDRADIAEALQDARRLAASTLHRYPTIDEEDLLAFFSGGKGFHLGVPTSLWRPTPSKRFHTQLRHFAEATAERAGVEIDKSTFDKVRLFRAPNSKHPKTGLHKRRLSFDELMHMKLEGIRQLAEHPEPFDLPEPTEADGQAERDWLEAENLTRREAEGKARLAEELADGKARLTRQTFEFIREGADEGDRHRLLFSAAANLGEFGCPPALAHALLTEAGLDCGLPPKEVRRQIDCGLRHARRTIDSTEGGIEG